MPQPNLGCRCAGVEFADWGAVWGGCWGEFTEVIFEWDVDGVGGKSSGYNYMFFSCMSYIYNDALSNQQYISTAKSIPNVEVFCTEEIAS